MFYIIKPNKLTKREQAAQDTLINFDYVLYDKIDLDMYKDNNLFSEYWKTVNMISIVKKIKECIYDNIQGRKQYKLYIVQEGISYGSSARTKSEWFWKLFTTVVGETYNNHKIPLYVLLLEG